MIILSGIIYFVIVFLMLMGWKYRKPGIFAWRTGSAVAILGVIQIFLTSDPLLILNEIYPFTLMIICFIIMPLLSQVSVCDSCVRRIYWRPLFSSRCSHCGEKLYWRQTVPGGRQSRWADSPGGHTAPAGHRPRSVRRESMLNSKIPPIVRK